MRTTVIFNDVSLVVDVLRQESGSISNISAYSLKYGRVMTRVLSLLFLQGAVVLVRVLIDAWVGNVETLCEPCFCAKKLETLKQTCLAKPQTFSLLANLLEPWLKPWLVAGGQESSPFVRTCPKSIASEIGLTQE